MPKKNYTMIALNDVDTNNTRVISDILKINNDTDADYVYNTYFRYNLTYADGVIILDDSDGAAVSQFRQTLMLKCPHKKVRQPKTSLTMLGGAPELIQLTTSSGDYVFRINEVVGHTLDISGKKYPPLKIIFLSLMKDTFKLDGDATAVNCITLIIDQNTRVGEINGLSRKYNCIGVPKHGDPPYYIYDGEDQGMILMKGVLNYVYANRTRFNIDQIELNDSATRECRQGRVKLGEFVISKSNMLQGRHPYYMRFKFKPIHQSAIIKINENLEIMSTKKLTDIEKLVNYLASKTKRKINRELVDFLIKHENEYVSKVLETLMKTACETYAEYVEYFFDYYELNELRKDETRYVFIL